MEYERQSQLLRLVIVAAFAAEAVIFIHWIPDDAYISFRYARNLAHGAGLRTDCQTGLCKVNAS